MSLKNIKTSKWAKLFKVTKADQLSFNGHDLHINNSETIVHITDIQLFHVAQGMIWDSFNVVLKNGKKYNIDGFRSNEIKEFSKYFEVVYAETYYSYHYSIAYEIYKVIPTETQYWRISLYKQLAIQAKKFLQTFQYLKTIPASNQQTKVFKILQKLSLLDDTVRIAHNNKFLLLEKKQYKPYFDNIEKFPLTDKQQDAVIVNEKNNLILAGAGSGKTSVMVAKAGYLVQKFNVNPKHILLLAFNKKASVELQERIQEKLNLDVDSMTFHALGLSIIAEVENKKPLLGSWAEDQKNMERLLQQFIDVIVLEDSDFANLYIEYFQQMFSQYKSKFEFKTHGDYIEYLKSIELRTFDNIRVKSYEECEIANFLFLNHIRYEYEAPYIHDTATKEHRQYQPDFYLPDYKIYIEHFGIDKNGNTAPFVEQQGYHEGMVWKRALHRHYNTNLLETYSCEKQKGVLTTNLKTKLEKRGVSFDPISIEAAISFFNESGRTSAFTKLTSTFLSNYKSNTYSISDLKKKADGMHESNRLHAYIKLFEKIYDTYEVHQKTKGMIDFNDMINKAIHHIQSGAFSSKYTHILVDEFQDISTARSKIVEGLMNQHENTTLTVVGDDWQSINRFAGSDISIIRNFADIYGDSKRVNLDYTFRFNNKISKVTQSFIEANPNQLTKNIKTITMEKEPKIFVWYDSKSLIGSLDHMFKVIAEKEEKRVVSIFVLARFWFIIPRSELYGLERKYPLFKITPLSVHASKGLEADYVIVLGNEPGKFGFPSSMEDDPIVDLVLAESENYEFAEERRLLYVAMTRAKKEVHLFTNSSNTSSFVEELIKNNAKDIIKIGFPSESQGSCPSCLKGRLVRKENKRMGNTFLACTYYPYCTHTQPLISCKKCNDGVMVKSRVSKQYICSNKQCNNTIMMCPKCNSALVERDGRNGKFLGCSSYPKCKYTKNILINKSIKIS